MTIETANQNQTDPSTAFLRAARAGQLDKILTLLNQDIDINVSNANGLNAMHLASKDGHSEVVSVLLQRGAHIDAATKKGNTALHIAALAGQEAVVRLLVQNGAQVNIQSQNGFTPLYMAAQENHDGVVKFLLANGANQSLATEDGFTPLAVAMQQGHEKVVAVLLEADTGRVRLPALHIAAKKDDCKAATLLLENDHNPDVTSKSGFTPLHIAAHYGNEAVAKLLLNKGADVNCAAKHNICPLHVAAKWGKANMVALLAENGAQVEARTRDGLTPLHCAARSGHEHVVDMLLERGAPISGKSKNGLAPLHMAAQGDHSDAARILLYHRAPVDDLTVDYLTALHVAAHCGHVKVAKLLLDRNADANARALNGFTPLHIACKKNRIKVVELLLKYGASISATTESGLTPLHVAAFMGCMNIVIYLLQHEASPDVPTVRGETPLHLAARANQTDIIRILLRNGAAVDARAREMQTALHIASRLGNVDIVLLLVQHGAQLDALTADNYNALHIAAKQHNHEVAAVLLEHGAPPNAVTKKGFTPLHLAAKYGNLKVANLLMSQKNAELDPRGKNGVTPLHVAAQYKHHAVATALLEKGADPKAAAKNGHTALHIAARKNQMETAAALMERGAVVDAESRAGCTPLHLAAHQGHAEMCSLLMEQGAETGRRARSGLAALHLAAQEDHVPVAKILVNNGAKVDVCTKGGYTPLHVASHFGQTNMVKFLLESGADVQATTCHGYTALHHAAQQGHINIVNLLLEHKADANATTNNGQTPLDIAQRLGYVTVMDTLKGVSNPTQESQPRDEKYRPVAPETMYETFMSDSEEEGGEDTMLTDQPYRYLTVDDMKSLGDDSLPIDVTRDERAESTIGTKNIMEVSQESTASAPPYVVDEIVTAKTVNHVYNAERMKEGYCYNVDSTQPNFLVSFLVDARGGALKGCRGGGVRVIVPPLSAQQPTRITCRYVRSQRVSHMPPLMEGEALASRVLELGPVSAKFIGPIILEVPHFASLRGKEREIVILRSDNGTTWREHAVEAADCTIQDILSDTLDIDDLPEEPGAPPARVTRILTHDFPQYFAVISRIRQEVHAIGPEGGMVSSSVVPQVQAVFPQGALTKKIKVGLQAQTIEADLTAKLLGRGVAVSPVVTVEPRRRKFHKAITLSMPAPRPHSQGMINQYTTSAPTLRLLCSISGGTNRAHWEDVTDSTPLTFVNDCVSFTTTVSARYWLMDCRNVSEATKMATELYREAIHVPFMARFVVYAKRTEQLQAQLRVFCVTDDREDKTLERMEKFAQVAKSRDVEVHEGKPVFLEMGGNFSPVAKSGEQPKLEFRALRENRLHLAAMVRGAHADAVARCQFMREARRPKGEPAQTPICVLNIVLPEEVIPSDVSAQTYQSKQTVKETITVETTVHAEFDDGDNKWPDKLTDERITSICNLLGMDWVPLAYELGISSAAVANIRERGVNGAQQAALMLQLWRTGGLKAHDNSIELALCRIGREDVLLPQSVAEAERRIQRNIYQERQSSEEIIGYKSPDSEYIEKEILDNALLEQEDINKAFDKANEAERSSRDILERKDIAMDDSIGEREEAKYSPEEKSYIEEGSDREPSLSISEESEEEDGIKKSVAERKIQITRKLSSGKVSASKQKRELKEEIIEIKKQINPEIKKFHVQQTTAIQDGKESGKLSKKSSEEEEIVKKPIPAVIEQVEAPKEKVLPKAGPRHMQKHIRNESMIRFSSGDFSDVKVPAKKPEEKIIETKEETITKQISPTTKTETTKEIFTTFEDNVRTITTKEEIITVIEKDIAEAPLKEKISSFESKMLSEKTKSETEKSESTVKLTEEALKRHTEQQKSTTEYTEDFIKAQIRAHEALISDHVTSDETNITFEKQIKYEDPGSPDLVSDFAAELMKAEETFRASADFTSDKYTEGYFKGNQTVPKSFTKIARTDSTIVQFSSEEDSEFLKKSTDSETETESQIVTVKQQIGLIEGQIDINKGSVRTDTKSKIDSIFIDGEKSPLKIEIKSEIVEEPIATFMDKEKLIEHEIISSLKETDDKLRVDSLEDSLQISSDEDAQIQPTDDESESQIKDQLFDEPAAKVVDVKQIITETKVDFSETHARSDSMGSDFSKMSVSEAPQIESTKSPKHISQESPLLYSQSTADKTDSLADSVQSTERDMSYVSQSESKVYSKETRPTRSDSLDEASQFSDMEETQIGSHIYSVSDFSATKAAATSIKVDTMRFLEEETVFSTSELHSSPKKVEKTTSEEPAISAKARQFIETVPEDDSLVQDCFFSKRIYSDSLEESEQYGTDNDSRRPSEADSLKSDKSDFSGKDAPYKMSKISSEIEEGIDENLDSSLIENDKLEDEEEEPKFEFVTMKQDSKEMKDDSSSFIETSDAAQDALLKKVTTKRHSRNESISIIKFSSTELKDSEMAKLVNVPPEIPQRATEFQMFVTEAIDDYNDERVSSFDKEDLSDKISSESSREIEISEKKWSDGGTSDKISSEDAVTDKASSESAKIDESVMKASTDTILGPDAKSPDLVMDDKSDEFEDSNTFKGLQKGSPTLRKIETKLSGLKDLGDQPDLITTAKLDEALKSVTQSPGLKRASLGSAGDGSFDLLGGKRTSDAPSLTDSRDYTFEESEDSIPLKDTKQDIESKAKAILEPIYDKAIRAVRGDSLDDAEPFCMDQDQESSRLPGIQEQQQASEIRRDVAERITSELSTSNVVEKIDTISNVTVTIIGTDEKETKLVLTKDTSKDAEKEYSVHSSPDEVEEKICTDTESELDQAKVLEIIEPTSEGDNGFVPIFDTSKLKQDSLDDADDFFAEKEGIFEDMEEYAKQQFSSESKPEFDSSTYTTTTSSVQKTSTGTIQEVTKTIKTKIETVSYTSSSDLKTTKEVTEDTDSINTDESSDQGQLPERHILRSISEVGATAAASIGIELKPEDLDLHSFEIVRDSSVTSTKVESQKHVETSEILLKETDITSMQKDHIIKEISSDHSTTVAESIGKETALKREHSVTDLIGDVSSTLAASVGIELKPEEKEHESKIVITRKPSVTELIIDANSTLAASVGLELKSEEHAQDTEIIQEGSISKRKQSVTELLTDMTTTLAASVGLELKSEEFKQDKTMEHQDLKRKHSITELMTDASSTLAASIGLELKPDDVKYESTVVHEDKPLKREHSITDLVADASSTLAASVGLELKPDDVTATVDKDKIIRHEHSMAEFITEANHTLAKLMGTKPKDVELQHEEPILKREHSITELITDTSSTLAASVGVELKPDVTKMEKKDVKDEHSITKIVTDTSSTLTDLVDLDIKSKVRSQLLKHEKEATIKHEHHTSEVITDSKSTISTVVDFDIKPDEIKTKIAEWMERDIYEPIGTITSVEIDSTKDGIKEEVSIVTREEKSSSSKSETIKISESIVEKQISSETKIESEEKKDDEICVDLSPDILEDTEKIVSEMKDLNRADRRCSDLLEGISQPGGSLVRIDTSHVAHGLSLKFSKTPPPSPVDLIHRAAASTDTTGQQRKGPEGYTLDQQSTMLSPRDARFIKDSLSSDGDKLQSGYISEVSKVLSRSASPKSPTRHHVDNISFVNVDTLTMHPESEIKVSEKEEHISKVVTTGVKVVEEVTKAEVESKIKSQSEKIGSDFEDSRKMFEEETRKKFDSLKKDFADDAMAKFEQMKQEFSSDPSKKIFEDFAVDDTTTTTIITKKESSTHQISGKEFFSEKKHISSSDDDSVISSKIETKRAVSGEEYELQEKETFQKSGDVTHSERSSLERDQKASAERQDSEVQKSKKSGDEAAVTVTQREFSEQGLYSGRQSKSEEKMTAIKDDVSKKSEVSYSERDLSHEQWGKEYFTERSELEPTEEVEGEFSQSKDVFMKSAVRIVEKDEKLTSEEVVQEGKVVSSTTGFSKEESIVESKEHDDMSSDISQDTSFKSEFIGKRDSFDDKSEMSPKSRSRSLKKEEVYEVDFIKEIKVSTSQKSKCSSQDISQDTHSESEMLGESDFIGLAHDIIPEDPKQETDLKEEKVEIASPEKKLSPVHKPEEHIQEHVWEVSLQQQESFDEVASDLPQQMKSLHEEPQSIDTDFISQSEPKSFTSGSDLGITTLASDLDLRVSQSGVSVTSSDDTFCVEAAFSDNLDSLKDSMIKSRESIETEYMIKSIDSQDTETLHKSMDSVSAETMQHSDKDDFSLEAEIHKKIEQKLLKEKSLEDICSSGYDTDLSSAEFLVSKLELERGESEPVRHQPLADLSDLEKTIDEVKQSLEAAHGEIIGEKSDGSIKYKQSPSEFEFKLISPDRPEVIYEESIQQPEVMQMVEQELKDTPTTKDVITSVSSKVLEEAYEVKETIIEKSEEITAKIKSSEVTVDEKESKTSPKGSDSSSKQDDTCFTSDDEKDTAQEKEKSTQPEYSDISTGLESGPISLVDTETELVSDKEDSPKDSPEAVKLRPVQKHLKSAHMVIGDRRSGSDVEGWSSSGESHYQSFEYTESPHSRPLSSDVEIMLTGHSTADFQSALTTQEFSTKSQRTSKDYVTAPSTLSSRGSVKSLDSESSGNVASIDISDASETLVPSAAELKEEMIESSHYTDQFELKDKVIPEVAEESLDTIKEKDDTVVQINIPIIKGLVIRTTDSNDQSDEGSLDEELTDITEGSTEIICKMKRSHEMSFQPKELLPEKFPSESFSESTDLEIDSGIPESDSQVFSMSKIETGPSTIRHTKESTESKSSTKSKEASKSYEISEKIVEYRTSSVVYKTPEKKPKPTEVETIIERKVVTIKAEPRPIHVTTVKREEIDFEALDASIIPKGTAEYEEIVSTQVIKSQSGTTVSSSSSSDKKTPEPYPIDSKQSSSSSLKIQDDHLSTPQTPISNPSQSSESTDNGREYVLDDMYEISEDPELFASEKALTDSKSEISVTVEERTLYETQKEPDSPTSDEFEMVDKPNEMDDFVVIEEVAREASEFDSEGKSLSISKGQLIKKHDEEVEQYLSQTAKKASETEYSTSGSLSEEEIGQYELEQRKLRAQENAEIEAGKKWIQMQFEGDLAAARYDYDRGPLEDIKEEEMADFDASRIGSFTSQKESVGSYGSLKNSYGSMSEADLMLRRRYLMRSGDQDDISVSSLQEFENLEQILSMEAYQHSSSSQDSLNGSLPRRYHRNKNAQGDDVSMSSLKEFEGLESACLEALKIEITAKQKEALLLSQDGRLSSAGFLDMEKRSYSHGSSDSSPPQKSGSSPGQKSGSPSQKSGSPSQKSGSPGQKSGSPGQKYGSPSQKVLTDAIAIRKMIDQQMAEGGDPKTTSITTDGGATVTYVMTQKKVYDNRGAFYVPDSTNTECTESVCVKKSSYECKDEELEADLKDQAISEPSSMTISELGSSFTDADANMIGVITTTKVIHQRFVDGKKVSETITSSGKGMDIPGAVRDDQTGEYGSGSFPSIEIGSGASASDYGSEFSSSITSQQSDTESLVTMMEKPLDSEHGSELGSLESITVTKKILISPRQLDLDLVSKSADAMESSTREISPMSGKSGSGVFSSTASKHFTDPASGSWSGLDEDMSSSGSFSRVDENDVTLTSMSRAKEDLMLGSTDSLEQTSSNATRATYNYEVDTPMTGSLTSAGSNTMVSSLDTLEPVTAFFEKGEKTLRLSTEDCFTMDHSGSEHLEEYEIHEPDSDSDKHEYGKPQAKERTILFEGRHSSEDSGSSHGGATFFIGDTPITKGDKTSSESSSGVSDTPPVPAQRKSLTGSSKPIVFEKHKPKDDSEDDEHV